MANKGVLRGAKINSRHSTVIDAAECVILAAKRLPEVSKVVLAHIDYVGNGNRRIKFVPVTAGLRCVVRGQTAQQTLFIYTKDVPGVVAKLRTAFEDTL